MAADKPAWAVAIRSLREARGWSQAETVARLRTHSSDQLPQPEHLLRRWKAWEGGRNRPSEFYAPLIAATLGTVTAALFPPQVPREDVLAASGMDTLEVVARLQASSVDDATFSAVRVMVDALAVDYARRPPVDLLVEARQWLRRIADLHEQPLGLSHHRQALELAGWLALLIGCLEYDLGDHRAAEATRRSALSLGNETGSAAILGWAFEMRAWFALTAGDYRGAVAAATAGRAAAGADPVVVQLMAQEAKAHARLGDRSRMNQILDKGRLTLESLPHPDNIDNHFVVDPAKYDFYVMDCYRHIGEVPLSRTLALRVLRAGTDTGGTQRSPMRAAEAHITLAVAAVCDGDLDESLAHGWQAVSGTRRSLPSLSMVTRDLVTALEQRYPVNYRAREFIEAARALTPQP